MKVIHVLRKPCSEGTVAANVLKYGTGAINVDGCRVGTDVVGWGGGGSKLYEGGLSRDGGDPRPVYGRWPANIVLQHLPTCEQTGTREEPGYTVNRFTDGAKPFGGGAGHPYESEHAPPSTVSVWACGAGCPVAGLDAQSGVSKTPTTVTRGAGGQHGSYSPLGAQADVPSYGDTGGASRFFKQVGGTVSGEE